MLRKKLISANWKMNKTIDESIDFANTLKQHIDGLGGCDCIIFPPFLSLSHVVEALKGTLVEVGAQNVFYETGGAFTGEISAGMIKDAGAGHVLIGHSERRWVIGEENEIISRKLKTALDAGIKATLCVGEKLSEREEGKAGKVVESQLASALAGTGREDMQRVTIAYEPVWAIGTGKTATSEDAEKMHGLIRGFAAGRFGDDTAAELRIQYGGSVKPGNAGDLLGRPEIDGVLIGGASLEVDSFVAIARAAL